MNDQRCAGCGTTQDLTLLTPAVSGCPRCIAQALQRPERTGMGAGG